MKTKIFISTILALLLFSLLLPMAWVSAAGVKIDSILRPPGAPTVTGKEQETTADISEAPTTLTFKIINFVLGFAGVAAIFFILNNAWYLVISSGSEEKITEHKAGLMWAVIGLILIILSYSIIRFVISIPLGADEAVTGAPAAAGGAPAAPTP